MRSLCLALSKGQPINSDLHRTSSWVRQSENRVSGDEVRGGSESSGFRGDLLVLAVLPEELRDCWGVGELVSLGLWCFNCVIWALDEIDGL